jgi:hypothetical protein
MKRLSPTFEAVSEKEILNALIGLGVGARLVEAFIFSIWGIRTPAYGKNFNAGTGVRYVPAIAAQGKEACNHGDRTPKSNFPDVGTRRSPMDFVRRELIQSSKFGIPSTGIPISFPTRI